MGLFKTLGMIGGAVVGGITGGPAGAVKGASIGSKIGGAVDGKGKSSSGGATVIESPKTPDLKKTDRMPQLAATKVAATANIDGLMEDPWQPAKEWWTDLGGDDSFERNLERQEL